MAGICDIKAIKNINLTIISCDANKPKIGPFVIIPRGDIALFNSLTDVVDQGYTYGTETRHATLTFTFEIPKNTLISSFQEVGEALFVLTYQDGGTISGRGLLVGSAPSDGITVSITISSKEAFTETLPNNI